MKLKEVIDLTGSGTASVRIEAFDKLNKLIKAYCSLKGMVVVQSQCDAVLFERVRRESFYQSKEKLDALFKLNEPDDVLELSGRQWGNGLLPDLDIDGMDHPSLAKTTLYWFVLSIYDEIAAAMKSGYMTSTTIVVYDEVKSETVPVVAPVPDVKTKGPRVYFNFGYYSVYRVMLQHKTPDACVIADLLPGNYAFITRATALLAVQTVTPILLLGDYADYAGANEKEKIKSYVTKGLQRGVSIIDKVIDVALIILGASGLLAEGAGVVISAPAAAMLKGLKMVVDSYKSKEEQVKYIVSLVSKDETFFAISLFFSVMSYDFIRVNTAKMVGMAGSPNDFKNRMMHFSSKTSVVTSWSYLIYASFRFSIYHRNYTH